MTTQETLAKRKRGEDVAITECPESDCLNIKFGDGDAAMLNLTDLSPEVLTKALYHGLKTKLIPCLPKGSSPRDKKTAVLDVMGTLLAGYWIKPREVSDKSAADAGLLYTALCRLCDGNHPPFPTKTSEGVRKYLDDLGKNEADTPEAAKIKRDALANWRGHEMVILEISKIKAERSAKGRAPENVDNLLNDLMLF